MRVPAGSPAGMPSLKCCRPRIANMSRHDLADAAVSFAIAASRMPRSRAVVVLLSPARYALPSSTPRNTRIESAPTARAEVCAIRASICARSEVGGAWVWSRSSVRESNAILSHKIPCRFQPVSEFVFGTYDAAFVQAMYEDYVRDPSSVGQEWREL